MNLRTTRKKRVRDLLCATAESLALATKSELEIESKMNSEDSGPIETGVTANLQEAAAMGLDAAASGDGARREPAAGSVLTLRCS
jgi:hypothetical protein